MSFGFGGVANASEVRVGTTAATAVYLGSEKVWPVFTPRLSPWYSPNGPIGQGGIAVPWPDGAQFCDVVGISGGAGGTGTGVGGNPQLGGGSGLWGGITIPRQEDGRTYTYVNLYIGLDAGFDGAGGGNFNTQAADGSRFYVKPSGDTAANIGPERSIAGGLDKTSGTGNRNGGSVAPSFVFNGRTYTLASYGAGAGQGGATGNKNGGPGSRPGGGGQSADNGGLTGYNGGNGAHGAAILYWY